MVQPAENRLSGDLAETLDRPMARRTLAQGRMCSQFVVITSIRRKDPAQVGFIENNNVTKALPADRANQPLHLPVLPG